MPPLTLTPKLQFSQVCDLETAPLVTQMFDYAPSMAMVRLIFAAEQARTIEQILQDRVRAPTGTAPTQSMLDEYKNNARDWPKYESQFLSLMSERRVEKIVPREMALRK